MAISNSSFETALQQSGVDVESVPSDWTASASASGLDAATFGPPYEWAETFEALWSNNEDAISAFVPASHLSDASFGSGLQQTVYDSFEQLWPDNEDAISAFESGHISAATFGSSATEYDSFGVEWPARHPVADTTRLITATFIDSTPSRVHTRLNELKADFNAHGADATVHKTADVTNVIGSPDATDLASSINLATELWDEVWPHITDGSLTWHRADFTGSLSKPDDTDFYIPTDYSECSALANALTYSLNLHFTWADASGYGYFTAFDPSAANIFAYPSAASFTGSPGSYDDFETQWMDNQNAYAVFVPGSHLSDADFTTDGAANAYESFETELTLQVLSAAGYGAALDINPGSGVRVTVSGTFVATLVLQVKRAGTTTWIDWDTTTAPGDIDVDEGYSSVRMRTTVYISGTPAAKLKWRPIETL